MRSSGRITHRLAPLVPDVARGVRAALATLIPFYLARTWSMHELAWTALGGWLGTLADPGGLRGTRARVLVAFALAGALVTNIAERAAATPAALGVLFVLAFAGSLLRALGAAATSVGSLLVVIAAIALGGLAHSPNRDALAFLVGAAWAVLLSSIVWPVWTHLPVRLPLAACWRALGDYVAAIDRAVERSLPPGDVEFSALAREHQGKVRAAIEEARAIALASRARRSGESPVGSNLRTLLALAERLLPLVTASLEEIELLPPASRAAPWQPESRALGAAAAEIARILSTPMLRAQPSRAPERPARFHRIVEVAEMSVQIARNIGAPPEPGGPALAGTLPARRRLADELRALCDAMSPRSTYFHHAARVALAVTAAQLIGGLLSPAHVQWVTVTTIGVLQPYSGATLKRAAERVVGTVLGSLVAVGITVTLRSPIALALVMFPLSVAAVATKPRSYRLFTLFLTPVFVLLAERWSGDWFTAAARAADAAIGGVIALAAALAFPSREAPRLNTALDRMVDALRAYARIVLDAHIAGASSSDAVIEVRRAAGVALGDAESSLERLLAEPLRPREGRAAEDAMLLVTHGRRFAGALTALDQRHARPSTDADADRARLVRDRVDRLLGPAPAPEPAIEAGPDLTRILRTADLLAQARS